MATSARFQLARRLSVDGRDYDISAADSGDDRVQVRITGLDGDGLPVAELAGEIPPTDLAAIAKVINSTFAGLAGLFPAPSTTDGRHKRRHPNHGVRWTPDDDAALLARHGAGASVSDLMAEFGRSRSGIISRLELLNVAPSVEPQPATAG
jgi:hypothetical protein